MTIVWISIYLNYLLLVSTIYFDNKGENFVFSRVIIVKHYYTFFSAIINCLILK